MSEIANSVSGEALVSQNNPLELRIFRAMIATVAIAVLGALLVAPWRATTGLILGGGLSLLNYHWLRTSMATIFGSDPAQNRPRIRVVRYILRYLMIGTAIAAAYKLQIVSLPMTIVGLCSFVPAFFVEASRQSYLAIIGREESF